MEIAPAQIMTKTSKQMRKSDYEMIKFIEDENRRWIDAYYDERERLFDAVRTFYDINHASWPEADRNKMTEQERHITSVNIAKQKMETLSGSLQTEEYDYDFVPLNNDYEDDLVRNIKHFYYADKEQNNYDIRDNETCLGGLIHASYQEMVIDYSVRRTGSIRFINCLDGTVLRDPYWLSNDYKDWRRAIKHAWFTPQEIIEKYETNDPKILTQAKLDEQSGYIYEKNEFDQFEDAPQKWASKYLVVEYRWLEKFKTTRLHAKMPTGEWIALPVGIEEAQVREFIQMYGVNWADIVERPYEDDILYFATTSPDLSRYTILSKGRHPIQCGSIGFFEFSSNMKNGIRLGAFETIMDIQRTLNYRQSKMDHVIANAASGALFVDKNKLGGDKKVREFERKKTHPGAVIGVDGNPQGIADLVPVGHVPEHLFREFNSLIDLFDRVSPVTPALEGAATSKESGILFEMRHAVTKLGTLNLVKNWQHFLMWKAEAWYNQAQITYDNIYMRVKKTDGSGFVEFNKPSYENGEKVYINDIQELPRARVVVTLKKSSPTEQMSRRLQLFDMNKIFAANPQEFKAQIRFVNQQLIETLPSVSPEDREYFAQLAMIQRQIDFAEELARLEAAKASIANSQVVEGQAAAMLNQITSQQQAAIQQMQQMPQGRNSRTSRRYDFPESMPKSNAIMAGEERLEINV